MINPQAQKLINALAGKKSLFITTSNRFEQHKELPKSTALALQMREILGEENCKHIDIPKLTIHNCEGNVSTANGNRCGIKEALLRGPNNPTGLIRCWASVNNPDDELYKVANAIFDAEAVIFFISTRWGQANAYYQKLIERLDWIENRYTTLQEGCIIEGKIAGCVVLGHNWRAHAVVETQKEVYSFFGFKVPDECSFHYQWTKDANDESAIGYREDIKDFNTKFQIKE